MPAKLPPQAPGEMLKVEQDRRKNSKLYRAESAIFIDGEITDIVTETATQLEKARDMTPISLDQTERIQDITMEYVQACAAASTLPTMSGLGRALGLTRRSLYDCITRNSPRATANWLAIVKEAFAEMLEHGSLRNDLNSIVAIFLLKAHFGLHEGPTELVVSRGEQTDIADMTQEERQELAESIMQKYQDLIED